MSVSSIGEEQSEEPAVTVSRDSNHQSVASSIHEDGGNTQTEIGQSAEESFLNNYARIKRSKSIASSLQVRDGYGTGFWYRFSYWATEMWFYDFLAWLISFYCFAGIVVTLLLHRDQPIPEWPFDITINALVAALSTVMVSTLLVPVSNTIGQLKWSWIQEDHRKLEDIAIYDEASRGPWGSLVLLLKKGFRGPFAPGALIMICALPMAPLLQQTTSVVLEKRPFADSVATLNALNWWAEGLRTEYGLPRIKDDMVMAINRGLFFDGNHSDPFMMNALQPRPQCHTGNCTFGVFESLAVCSECRDITVFATMQNSSNARECGVIDGSSITEDCARWSLPNGHDSGWTNASSGMQLSTNASRGLITLQPGLSIFNLTAVAPCWRQEFDNGTFYYRACVGEEEKKRAQAQECALQWCVNEYESEMTNGVLQEKVLSSTRLGDYAPGNMYDFNTQNQSLWYNIDFMKLGPNNGLIPGYGDIRTGNIRGKFSVHLQATQLISDYLRSELEGFTMENDTNSVQGQFGKPNVRRIYRANLGSHKANSSTQYFDVSPLFETMALSMTSALRTQAQARSEAAVTSEDYRPSEDSWDIPTVWDPIQTAPDRLVPVLRVRWAWITLPAMLEVFTFLLLCYMVGWKSQRLLPVWKSSPLPLLLLGSDMHDNFGDNVPRHIVDMEELAKEVSIDPDIAMGRAQRPVEKELPKLPWAARCRRWKGLRRNTESRGEGYVSKSTLGSYA
ncbi:hypothetical protein PG990_000115 [Apiospora arundinis]